jgi:hypothetical protein
VLRLRPGIPARQTHDYHRHGTTTLFAALSLLDGTVIGTCMPRHRAREFLRFLNRIDRETPRDVDLHLIPDNSSTHKSPPVQRWLRHHPAFTSISLRPVARGSTSLSAGSGTSARSVSAVAALTASGP